ncbi:DegT/DnrJ/EryC1/StrS family aminotransferase [Sporofaciens musculi]|uniref:DegT/DnrJ/EryC1/StrS family aminotransferase n=1 Tax=Sporofaciens musculi TaxID=2681861 RepID=UPI0025A0FE36|nr:DegT/DnrJ/EryC1/StrS family aminotransferase [Sporofaciens musculi]
MVQDYINDLRFKDLKPLKEKVWLASPTMHGKELEFMTEAYKTNWMTTLGENIDCIEKLASSFMGVKHAVALTCGTAAIHLAVKLAAERLYNASTGISTPNGLGTGGALFGKRVFCSDLTFDATVNPVVYEGGEPVFIDSEYDTWNMDPEALEKAFRLYPDVKLVILVHLYGIAAKIDEIREICKKNDAILIEDAAESLGTLYKGQQTGSFGDYGIISFNGNKIITGSSGGMLLVDDEYSANKARKWSTQSREPAPWYQHEELGYNYRVSNVVAGVVRGQWEFMGEHIERKTEIYQRYKKGLSDLPVCVNPEGEGISNHWLSCLLIHKEAMCETERSDCSATYITSSGKSCPTEILEALEAFHIEGRPIWKPMHLQNIYRNHGFVTAKGGKRQKGNEANVGADIFARGLCLPSDVKMTGAEQDFVIEIIRRCFA